MAEKVLNSWKEIASYLGRGVRTAQRWERDLKLPVRRPRGRSRSAVIAIPEEIDRWLKKMPPEELMRHTEHQAKNIELAREKLHHSTKLLVTRMTILQDTLARTITLCEAMEAKRKNGK